MRKMQKWIALVGVMAFLISAMIPAGALAQGVTLVEEPKNTLRSDSPEEPDPDDPGDEPEVPSSPVYVAGSRTTFELDYSTKETTPTDDAPWTKELWPVVLVNNPEIEIALRVANAPEGATYSWTRLAPDQTGSLEAQGAEYVARTGNGDMVSVGIYDYTCTVTVNGNAERFEFRIQTVGANLVPQPQTEPFKANESDADRPIVLEAVVDIADTLEDGVSKVNLGRQDILTALNNHSFEWKNDILGTDFDVFPYDATDNCGYSYDSATQTARLQILRIYNDGVMASQVGAGRNTYSVSSTATGINPIPRTITLDMIPILRAVVDGETSSLDGEVGVYTFVNATETSLTADLKAHWERYIAPRGNVRYVWTLADSDYAPVPSPDDWTLTTDIRAARVLMEVPSITDYTFHYTCEPTGAGISALNLSAEDKANSLIAKYQLNVRRTATSPDITNIRAELNNGTTIRKEGTYGVPIGEGNDLILKVEATPGVGSVLSYKWEIEDGKGGSATEIKDTEAKDDAAGYAIEDDGATLRILGVNKALDNSIVRVTATNRGDKTDSSYVRLALSDPVKPSSEIVSDPESTNNELSILEGQPYTLTVKDSAGISAGYLVYQWEQTTTVSGGEPKNWKEIEGANEASYTVEKAQPMRNEAPVYYRCKVSNRVAPATFNAYTKNNQIVKVMPTRGTITITDPVEPFERTIKHGEGGDLTFAVEAYTDDGKNNLKYQWYMVQGKTADGLQINDSHIIEGATENAYSPGPLGEIGVYIFKCKVSNADNELQSVWSEEFRITVEQSDDVPVIEVIGDTLQGVVEGDFVRLKVNAYTAVGDPLAYEWFQNAGDSWTAIAGATRKSLTLSNLKTTQNGVKYRCRVTNLKTNASNESKTFTVNVWRQEDVPVIITQPKGWTRQSGTAEAASASLDTTVEMGSNGNYAFNWQYWDEQSEEWRAPALDQLDINTDETASSKLEFNGLTDESGTYRCEIVNYGGTPAGARAYTDEVQVSVMYRHTPSIISGPKSQTATVGKTVTLRVKAKIYPEEELLYTWQVSEDNGASWRNCNGYDGTGYDTTTFTTIPMTQNMVGRQLQYRCLVEGAVNRVHANNMVPAKVTVTNPYPELGPSSISKVNVEVDEGTGERYLTGYQATRGEVAMTVRGIREDVVGINLKQGTKYTIEVADKNGKVLKNDGDQVTTGSVVSLVINNADGNGSTVVADELTVVIDGDVNGSGQMTINQLVSLANHLLGDRLIPVGAQRRAADLNGNGKVADIGDLARAARLLVG